MEDKITSLLLDLCNLAYLEPEIVMRQQGDLYFADVKNMITENDYLFIDENKGFISQLAAIKALITRKTGKQPQWGPSGMS